MEEDFKAVILHGFTNEEALAVMRAVKALGLGPESTAFAMRDVIETMESLGGRVSELTVTGNPARNPVWNQIKADITGRPLIVPSFPHAELMGDLCLALAALGEYNGPADAAEALAAAERVHEPDPALRGLYDEMFGLYRESYRVLKPVFADLSKILKE